ncbi:MAG: single-stranded DNA-binding protein [Peptostreptococcaceae bacterium]
MYASITLLGRISKDVNLKYIKNTGTALCEFDVAVERKINKKETVTDYYPIQIWGNYGETLANRLDKGQVVFIVGSCKNEMWKDDKNITRKNFKVKAEFVRKIDSSTKLSSMDIENLESKLIESSYEDNTF